MYKCCVTRFFPYSYPILACTRKCAHGKLLKMAMHKQQILKAILVIILLVIRMKMCLNMKRSAEKAAKFIPDSELEYFCPGVHICGSKRVLTKVSSEDLMQDYDHCCEG